MYRVAQPNPYLNREAPIEVTCPIITTPAQPDEPSLIGTSAGGAAGTPRSIRQPSRAAMVRL